jgi:predicted lipoprotein with Yx(FWY)xxD motif
MNNRTRTATAAFAAALFAAAVTGCSGSSGGSASDAATARVDRTAAASPAASASAAADTVVAAPSGPPNTIISKSGSLGTILLDAKGRTLYVFDKDTSSKSMCTGSCATQWPPSTVTTKPKAGKGVKSAMLSTSTRSDNKKQVTYNGHPLYTFAGDQKPGDTSGQGVNAFGAKWYVIGTNGKQITKSASSQGGGGGGY